MRKLTSALVILLLGATAFAQSSRYEDLEYFDKVILKGNVKKVSLENGDREIVVDGADKNSVKLSRLAGIITLEITSSGPVAVSITNGSLKWIEASSETEIEGAEYLSGGKGKYLVVGMKDSKGRSNNENFNFNFDDFDFDFDYDFDSDFDFDFDFDYDFDFNFDRDYSYNYDYNYDYKYDRKVNRVKEKNDN
jgi:hypothetical protein